MIHGKLFIVLISILSLFVDSCGNDRISRFEMQNVSLVDFAAQGYILDIGGGGEGVIGRLKGSQVIAIDISKRELEEAPAGPLKIVMDARDLKFLNDTFNTATSFFTLMYIKGRDHNNVFKEIFRVLKPGGQFLVWDAIIPKQKDKNMVVVPLSIKLPNEEVQTGYGVSCPDEDHDLHYYARLAEKAGFEVVAEKEKERVLFLELRKP